MNNTLMIENKLQDILFERAMTQKDLAKMIEEREATISEFIKLKRTTINIDLLLKIASALNIKDIEDILSFKETLRVNGYDYNNWYTLEENNRLRFAYLTYKNKSTFEFAEVLDEGIFLHKAYEITDCSIDDVVKEFLKKSNTTFPERILESKINIMLIYLCRRYGKIISNKTFKTVDEAIEALELLV